MSDITNIYEQEPKNGQAPGALVLLLHGLGSNGRDLISLAPYWADAVPHAVFASPDAPFVCDMVPPGYPDSYQWFSLQNRDPAAMIAGIQEAHPILESFILEQAKKYDVPLSKTALVGFSQGTMMSLYTGPRLGESLAGILGFSGALLWGQDTKIEELQKPAVRLIHGEADDVVSVEAYGAAMQALDGAGFETSGHTTPGLGHSIDGAGIESGAKFLTEILG